MIILDRRINIWMKIIRDVYENYSTFDNKASEFSYLVQIQIYSMNLQSIYLDRPF